jgi:hypothetical protein
MDNTTQEEKSPKKRESQVIKKLKQKIYKWHLKLGIITLIPVLFWILSGVMHPFMAHFFKPTISNEQIEIQPIDKKNLIHSIQEVLQKNAIAKFKNFRIVQFDDNTYYQVKTIQDELLYFNTLTAKKLANGDAKYAEWLSRYFLDDQKNTIAQNNLLTDFTPQYKYINRYLPVYKITFDCPDATEVYVETATSKLATFNPKSRQFFIWFFDTFHNWSFIDAIGNTNIRVSIMILLLSIIGLSALSGIVIYGLFWKQFKKIKTREPKKGIRQYHRQIGIWIAVLTLTFAFSGAYHATTKWQPYTLDKMVYEPSIAIDSLIVPNNSLNLDWKRLENLTLVTYNDCLYYRCILTEKHGEKDSRPKFAHKINGGKKASPPQEIIYINATTNQASKNLDIAYAQFLASYFSDNGAKSSCCEMESSEETPTNITDYKLNEAKVLTDFDSREYGFVNKRLPVVKLAFDNPSKTSFYIEIATSRLAAKIENSNRIEGYSFAIFHKFLFMDWAGKNVRDAAMVLAALSILLVSGLGLLLFLKK